MTTSVAIVGHSHTSAVAGALAAGTRYWTAPEGLHVRVLNIVQLVADLGIDRLEQTLTAPDAPPRVHPGIAAEIDRAFAPDARPYFVSMLGGNGHNIMGLLRHQVPFDFVLPEASHLPLEAGAQVIPYGAMRALLERRLKYERNTFEAMRRQYPGPYLHLESPPPPRDDDYVVKSLDDFFRNKNSPDGIVSAALRYKLWRLHSTIVQSFCEALGMTFVRTPVEACDPDGYLAPQAYANATHANAWYGGLLLRQVEAIVTAGQDDRRAA
jgi:hypothetical protein